MLLLLLTLITPCAAAAANVTGFWRIVLQCQLLCVAHQSTGVCGCCCSRCPANLSGRALGCERHTAVCAQHIGVAQRHQLLQLLL
jgi:hypothetical protein